MASDRAELARITRQAEGLSESEQDVAERLNYIREQITSAEKVSTASRP